jgi:hypothetical protein
MSPSEMDRKIRTSCRKDIPNPIRVAKDQFARVIADALHRDFGDTHAAVKIVVGLTNANERAVKNWFDAKNGPTGEHLVDLVRISDEVLHAVLILAGRHDLVVAKRLADSKLLLTKMIKLVCELQEPPVSDPRDVIYEVFYSAFVKDHPAARGHWLEAAQSAHLTKVVMLELEANGFEIRKEGT